MGFSAFRVVYVQHIAYLFALYVVGAFRISGTINAVGNKFVTLCLVCFCEFERKFMFVTCQRSVFIRIGFLLLCALS